MLNFQLIWKQPCPKCHESREVIHALQTQVKHLPQPWAVRKEYQQGQPGDVKCIALCQE